MSKIFREYKNLDLKKIAAEIYQYWKKNNIVQKSFQSRNLSENRISTYIFYEGPPSLNGSPGLHHMVARTIKDIFCRYHAIKGKKVIRKAGWDTHGLPVELNVEKKMGITKNDIGKNISVEEYNKICKIFVNKSMKEWIKFTDKIGYWLDMKNPFVTYHSKYIESIWWLIKTLYQKKILYKDYTIQPYSPAAGTGLSHHELNMPGTYKEVKQIAPTLKFKAKKETLPKEIRNFLGDIYFISWTTTPWTLPSNTALAIGSNIDYLLVKIYNPYTFLKENIIFAKELIHKVLLPKKFYPVSNIREFDHIKTNKKKLPYLIEYQFKGKKIIQSRYEQLLPWFKPYHEEGKAFQIIEGSYVNTIEGTGIVHVAPTFGIEDFQIAREHNIPSMFVLNEENKLVPLVDTKGRFLNNFPHGFGGRYVKEDFDSKKNKKKVSVDQEIVSFLDRERKVFQVEIYTHFYPHCWRTEKPILYYPLDSWFINTTKVKNKMILLNKSVNWYPKFIGKKRFESWLKNVKNWNLSRSRYWGTPLPIWRTKDGKEEIVIGSIKELFIEIQKSIEHGFMSHIPWNHFTPCDMKDENYEKIDLHKHFLDNVILVSGQGQPMNREPDLIDVWFDSGAMPYAQFHYPFENKDLIDKKLFFPADFIAEGLDQTRGWFFTLHVISSILFNSVAYKNVISTGLVLDEKGHKMSKSKGNTINPFNLIEDYGPDAIRWYIVFNSEPWDNLKFNIKEIHIGINKFFGTIYNIYSFFVIYANIDRFSYKEKDCYSENKTNLELDFWILSELNTMIKIVDEHYSNYNPTKAARFIFSFVLDKLSNWYIRLCRRRFWKEEYTKNKISAYQILYKCLITIAKLISPITPFFSEKLYMDLNSITKKENFESVHLADFPVFDSNFVNKELEKRMVIVQKITTMVFSIRKKNGIKIRQPLQKLLVLVYDQKIRFGLQNMSEILKQEINVKEIEYPDSTKYLELKKRIQPNYRSLGPRFGNKTQKISEIIKRFTHEEIQEMEVKKKHIFLLEGEKVVLFLKDVKITTEFIKNWSIIFDNELTIALDLRITNSLWEECFIREFIRYIQKLRKKCNYEVVEKILIYINAIPKIKSLIQKHKDYICQETLAVDLLLEKDIEKKGIMVNFEDNSIYILIQKVENI
ncbi:isoleucine--tRNA ligase [Blattabacterium cuenoti]|uniref:isoleucine--tRNA ligase n=1 Tax=Blattabacterium cuenoti TaxID=1653831 RepID=UPI00163CB508|nr:isoleucine--tRNA ligase [Blattabacterium cuenoti]